MKAPHLRKLNIILDLGIRTGSPVMADRRKT
jgi:hypothetical protein